MRNSALFQAGWYCDLGGAYRDRSKDLLFFDCWPTSAVFPKALHLLHQRLMFIFLWNFSLFCFLQYAQRTSAVIMDVEPLLWLGISDFLTTNNRINSLFVCVWTCVFCSENRKSLNHERCSALVTWTKTTYGVTQLHTAHRLHTKQSSPCLAVTLIYDE